MRLKDYEISPKVSLRPVILFFLFLNYAILIGISFSRDDFFHEHIENFGPDKISLVVLTFLFLLGGYGLLFQKTFLGELKKNEKIILILTLLALLITPPFLSRDVGGYVLGARNLVWFHVNPFLTGLGAIRENSWIGEIGWNLAGPYSYGPVMLILSSIAVLPNFLHLIGAVYLFKLMVFAAYVLSIWIFARIVKLLLLSNDLILLYAANPAILINGVIDGHNDIFIGFFLLLAIYFLVKKDGYRSFFSWIMASFVKYNTLIFLPIFWKEGGQFSRRKIVFSILGLAVVTLVLLGIFFGFHFNDLLRYVLLRKGELEQGCLYRCSPVIYVAELLAGSYSGLLQLVLFILAYVYIFFRFLVRDDSYLKFIFWSYLALIFVLTKWTAPWYPLVIIPVGLLIGNKTYKVLVFLLTIYSLFHFFGLF